MTKSLQAEVKKLTKELNLLKGKVNNLEGHVEAHGKTLEGDFMRASKNVKKGGRKSKKSSSKKRVMDTDGLYCCTKCKPDDYSSDKWKKKFVNGVRVFRGKNSKKSASTHHSLQKQTGKHGHTAKLYDTVKAKKKK